MGEERRSLTEMAMDLAIVFLKDEPPEDRTMATHAFVRDENDEVTVMTLAMLPEEAFHHFASETLKRGTKESLIMVDRFCQDGQGTTLDSCVTFYHWDPDAGWDCSLMEYDGESEDFHHLPLDGGNEWWARVMEKELSQIKAQFFTNGKIATILQYRGRAANGDPIIAKGVH